MISCEKRVINFSNEDIVEVKSKAAFTEVLINGKELHTIKTLNMKDRDKVVRKVMYLRKKITGNTIVSECYLGYVTVPEEGLAFWVKATALANGYTNLIIEQEDGNWSGDVEIPFKNTNAFLDNALERVRRHKQAQASQTVKHILRAEPSTRQNQSGVNDTFKVWFRNYLKAYFDIIDRILHTRKELNKIIKTAEDEEYVARARSGYIETQKAMDALTNYEKYKNNPNYQPVIKMYGIDKLQEFR